MISLFFHLLLVQKVEPKRPCGPAPPIAVADCLLSPSPATARMILLRKLSLRCPRSGSPSAPVLLNARFFIAQPPPRIFWVLIIRPDSVMRQKREEVPHAQTVHPGSSGDASVKNSGSLGPNLASVLRSRLQSGEPFGWTKALFLWFVSFWASKKK